MHAPGHCTYIRTKYSVAPKWPSKIRWRKKENRLRNKTIAYKWAFGISLFFVHPKNMHRQPFFHAHSVSVCVVFQLRAMVRLFGIIQFPEIYIGHFHHKIGAFDLISMVLFGNTVCAQNRDFQFRCIFHAESIAHSWWLIEIEVHATNSYLMSYNTLNK